MLPPWPTAADRVLAVSPALDVMCLLIDPEAVLFDPDPKSRSGVSARVIGYSPSVGAVVVVLVRRADRPGAWWGANEWRANSSASTGL